MLRMSKNHGLFGHMPCSWPTDFRIAACKCIALADPKTSHTTTRKILYLEVNCRPNYKKAFANF
jgi:hypothetical protein